MSDGGNGLTQKEWNARFDGKMDYVMGALSSLQIQSAVHEAKPIHSGAADTLEAISSEQKVLRGYVNKGIGVALALSVAAPFIYAATH